MLTMVNRFASIAFCCLVSLSLGCHEMGLPNAKWQMFLADRKGHLQMLTCSAPELFRVVPSFRKKTIRGIVSSCRSGWLDSTSGRLATLELDDTGYEAIRVYDKSMSLLGEYKYRGSQYGEGSGPTLSAGGERIAFVDAERSVIIVEIEGNKKIKCQKVSQVPISKGITRIGPLVWIDDNTLVLGSPCDVYAIDLESGGSQVIDGSGELLGILEGGVITTHYPAKVIALMGLDGQVHRVLGRDLRGSYSGCWIHRTSPDGQYVAYEHPVAGGLGGQALVIQHLESGRKTNLRGFTFPVWMGSWTSPADAPSTEPENTMEKCRDITHEEDIHGGL